MYSRSSVRGPAAAGRRSILMALLALVLVGAYVVVEARPGAKTAAAATQAATHAQAATRAQTAGIRAMPAARTGPLVAASDPALTGPAVTSVSQGTDLLDIFGVDAGQRIYHASWRPDDTQGWKRSAQLNGGVAARGTSVYAVSRFNGRLDAFAVGTDRRVWTAFKQDGLARGAWQGWWPIDGLTVQPNSSVHAVKMDRNNMEIIAVGADRKIYTNFWTAALDIWQGWKAIPGINAAPDSTVYGISLSANSFEVFAVRDDYIPHKNSWGINGWSGWFPIITPGVNVLGSSGIWPVKFAANKIAVFSTDIVPGGGNSETRYEVVTSTWDRIVNTWSPFKQIGDGRALYGTTVYATSRRADHIDVFHVGRDRKVYTTAYNPTQGWLDWWEIGGQVAPGTSVFAHSRSTDHLDIFAISPNTGTYTRGWDPVNGWGCWCEVGPYGQAGDAITQTFHVDFNNGVEVKGWARLMVSSSGAWNFAGHFDADGPLTYNVSQAILITTPSGLGFKISQEGRADGWLDGGDDMNWNRAGVDPGIAAAWAEIRQSSDWNSKAKASLDVRELIDNLLLAAAYAVRILSEIDSAQNT